jgi:hypothetical protein
MRQIDHQEALLAALEPQRRRAEVLAETLTAEQLVWRPPAGGWSVAQAFEHMVIAADSYLDRIGPIVEAAALPDAPPVRRPWKPSVMGGLLVRSLQSPRKLPAPKIYRPGPRAREDVIAAFIERHRRTAGLLERSVGLVWSDYPFRSPVTRLIRMNLGDAFSVLVVHAERHLGQVDRILALH